MNRTLSTPLLLVCSILAANALVAATALLSAPAFASGYGPLPSYEPMTGAPASQCGPSPQTLALQCRTANADACAHADTYDTRSESGWGARTDDAQSFLARH